MARKAYVDWANDLLVFRDVGGPGPDTYPGTPDNDVYDGQGGGDSIAGAGGNDTLHGGDNGDGLHGNAGRDKLFGDDGKDWLWGDEDNDVLTGGSGSDGFGFATGFGKDRITDFDARGFGDKQDAIDLSDVDSIVDYGDLIKHHLKQRGANIVIDAGHGDKLTIEDVKIHDIDSSDFIIF